MDHFGLRPSGSETRMSSVVSASPATVSQSLGTPRNFNYMYKCIMIILYHRILLISLCACNSKRKSLYMEAYAVPQEFRLVACTCTCV